MVSRSARALLLVWVVAVFTAGCASTRLDSTWRDQDDRGGPLRKVAIFVITKDQNLQRFAEDQAVRSLPAGTAGVASYTIFARPDEDETKVRERLTREGYDGAIVSRTVAVDKSKTYVPPQAHIVPGPFVGLPYYGSFYGYYPWAYHTYVTPGYMLDTTRILIETLVYRLPNGKPVWSGVTESINPDSSLDLVKELVRILRAELQKEQLLVGG